jgi:protein-tyrosine phosphatase
VKDGLYHILFVCTGNICRSPMAEGILRARLSPRAAEFASVGSAGGGARRGEPASPHSVSACRDHRIDISSHRSRPVTPELIEQSDLILTMEDHHREAILRLAPRAAGKTVLLSAYARGPEPGPTPGIPDPIGLDLEAYRIACRQIDDYLTRALPRIEESISRAAREP